MLFYQSALKNSEGIFLTIAFLVSLLFTTHTSASTDLNADVIVVANFDSPESLELANYYIQKRSIPKKNLIVVKTTLEESISRESFVSEILNPIRVQLLERNLIEGDIDPNSTDYHGRYRFRAYETHFKYLVLCKGLPLKISNQRIPEPNAPKNIAGIFKRTESSVDSDLALLSAPDQHYTGWLPNPLFGVKNPSRLDYTTAISVCRLDGPTFADAKRIIDDSIQAEQQPFLFGRAYIDLHNNHKDGNLWLKQASILLKNYGYDVDVIPTSHLWSIDERNENPAIYFGWYSSNALGPPVSNHPVPVGAIAAHIHSFSARTIRSIEKAWVGPLIHAGFAVSFGNVFEPYLQLTLRPDRFIELLLQGYCVGDATLFAQNALSWQNVTIADPLYRPFKPSDQWDPEEILKDQNTSAYARVTAINRIANKDRQRAIKLAIDSQTFSPTTPVAIKLLEDYPDSVKPDLQQLLIDYLISERLVPEELVPVYIQTFQKLKESGDNPRVLKMKSILDDSAALWTDKLLQTYHKSIGTTSKPTTN